MSQRTLEEINQTEKEYWNEGKLERTKVKKLRRHSFYYSYKREKRILDKLVQGFQDKNVLEIGSYTWHVWFNENTKPEKLTCINISESELDSGKKLAETAPFEVAHFLMDANNLTFEDNTFDVVFGGAILHHLDIEKTMSHVHRILKPGGKIVFLEPLNMNPLYKLYRKLNPKERTPDEHALVAADFKVIRKRFTFNHHFLDFFSVITGYISLKLFGDKKYNNWINKTGYNLDVFFSKIPFMYPLFARVIIYGTKK